MGEPDLTKATTFIDNLETMNDLDPMVFEFIIQEINTVIKEANSITDAYKRGKTVGKAEMLIQRVEFLKIKHREKIDNIKKLIDK